MLNRHLTGQWRRLKQASLNRAEAYWINLINGKGGHKYAKAGRELLLQSCYRGDPLACNFFAVAVGQGDGGPIDLPAARQIFSYSCDKGNADACFYSAKDYTGAMGLPANATHTSEALKKDCNLGNAKKNGFLHQSH